MDQTRLRAEYATGLRTEAERRRLAEVCRAKSFSLFDRLGVDESRGDRMLFVAAVPAPDPQDPRVEQPSAGDWPACSSDMASARLSTHFRRFPHWSGRCWCSAACWLRRSPACWRDGFRHDAPLRCRRSNR